MAFLPAVVMGAAALYQGARAKQAADANAQTMQNEGAAAMAQGVAAENLQRHAGREALGRETAAFGGAGVGYGGSSGTALKQSKIYQELDALTTRYRGAFTAYGYNTEAKILRQEGDEEQASGILLAGSKALGAFGSLYSKPPASAALGGGYTAGELAVS